MFVIMVIPPDGRPHPRGYRRRCGLRPISSSIGSRFLKIEVVFHGNRDCTIFISPGFGTNSAARGRRTHSG